MFDFTLYRNILLISITMLVTSLLVLMYVAYKIGRLKGMSSSLSIVANAILAFSTSSFKSSTFK